MYIQKSVKIPMYKLVCACMRTLVEQRTIYPRLRSRGFAPSVNDPALFRCAHSGVYFIAGGELVTLRILMSRTTE